MTTIAAANALRVLLIDDDHDLYVLTRAMLEDDQVWRFQVDWASTYEQALSRLASERYDAALVDFWLGAHTGEDLLKSETFRNARVAGVMLTGDASPKLDASAMAAGALDYLVKSEVTPETLKRTLRYAVERQRVATLLEQRADSLRAILEDSTDVVMLLDAAGTILFASGSVRLVDGFDDTELVGRHVLDRVHPDDVELLRQQFERCGRQGGGRCGEFEYRQRHRDGSWRDREAVAVNRLGEPAVAAIVFTYRDVTARNAAQAQQAHLATIVESSADAIYSRSLDGEILSWNGGAERLLGYTADEAVGQHISLVCTAETAALVPVVVGHIRNGESIRELEVICRRKDGTSVPVSLTVSPIRDRSGRVIGASGVAHDITVRHRALAALAESEAKHRSTFNDAPVGMTQTALDGRILRINRRMETMLGYSNEELEGTPFAAFTHPDDVEDNSIGQARLLDGKIEHYRTEKRYRRKDGSFLWVHVTVSVHRHQDGTPAYFIAVVEDISQRKLAEAELDHIFNLSPDMIGTAGFDGRFTRVNAAFRQVLGYDDATFMASPFISFVHPEDRASTLEAMQQLAMGQSVFGFTNRYRTADGSYRWLEWHSKADPSTKLIYTVARDQSGRRLLEEQLRQAQKMEAVGRLAGGIAHDFNNLLTAIIGFSEMALSEMREGDSLRQDIEQILNAGQSAAALTKQLLAFSRKQILHPQVLDLPAVIRGMHSLLQRLIGEDVTLDLASSGEVPRIFADRGQLEQVVMNLAVNARDAMPSGGTLRVGVDAVVLDEGFVARHPGSTAGPHVRLTVSDTGVGMGPEVLAHLFEPFFTTKEKGKGTGLGLATVYGIVKQSAGYIAVESVPGQGTSFRIHFPCAPADSATEPVRQPVPQSVAGRETILVVEDQEEVRAVVRNALQAHGYTVIEAPDGPSALALLPGLPQRVDLLLTDVVMPHMSGRELAERTRQLHGKLRVLYMSGYTDDAIVRHGVVAAGIDLLPKPFAVTQLLTRIREVLDRTSPADDK
jgi:two-component system cell cycle sensor histidine kinase/response regulator CckA